VERPRSRTLGDVILVDEARWPFRSRRWAHLVSDRSYEELHRFAERLGLPRSAFQGDHYDVPSELRDRALRLGATAVGSRELVVRLRSAGLRRTPTTHPARRGARRPAG
jgi:2-hydroxychromene-2-carboxylate isomerase